MSTSARARATFAGVSTRIETTLSLFRARSSFSIYFYSILLLARWACENKSCASMQSHPSPLHYLFHQQIIIESILAFQYDRFVTPPETFRSSFFITLHTCMHPTCLTVNSIQQFMSDNNNFFFFCQYIFGIFKNWKKKNNYIISTSYKLII